MPFNGSGTFTNVYTWVNDLNANIPITASRFDTQDSGIATGLSTCIAKDGQTTITANLPMAGFIHTGVGSATATDSYPSAGQLINGSLVYGTVGGSASTITLALLISPGSYTAGQTFYMKLGAGITGATTVNVNTLGAKAIQFQGAALTSGAYNTSDMLVIVYDGTQFQSIGSPRNSLSGYLVAANNLSDLVSAATARTNLGLGTAAVQNVGAFAQVANNLSDVTASTARTNLAVAGTGTANTFSAAQIWQALGTFQLGIDMTTPMASPSTTEVGYMGSPYNTQAANYVLVLADRGKTIYHTGSTAHAWTIPPNSSVAYPIGTIINFYNAGTTTGAVTLTQGAGVTLVLNGAASTGNKTLAINCQGAIQKYGTDTWVCMGNIT